MTIKEFEKLSEHERFDVIFTQGDFIEYWIEENKRFALYSVQRFYVELEYDSVNNKIVNLITFNERNDVLLNKYAFFRK